MIRIGEPMRIASGKSLLTDNLGGYTVVFTPNESGVNKLMGTRDQEPNNDAIQEPNNGVIQEPNNDGPRLEAESVQEPNNDAIQEPNNI